MITANDGPNVGRVFRSGMWITLAGRFFAKLMPGGGGVRPSDEIAAVVVHVDQRQRLLHVLCPRDFRDAQAFTQSLPRFIKAYKGDPISLWHEFCKPVLQLEVDGDDIIAVEVADGSLATCPLYQVPVDTPTIAVTPSQST